MKAGFTNSQDAHCIATRIHARGGNFVRRSGGGGGHRPISSFQMRHVAGRNGKKLGEFRLLLRGSLSLIFASIFPIVRHDAAPSPDGFHGYAVWKIKCHLG